MKIVVLIKMVPDVVEDLEIAPGGKTLDFEPLRMVPNESDEHALEEALLLKERYGAKVLVLGLDAPQVDEVLFAALVRGADRAIKVTGVPAHPTSSEEADIFTRVVGGVLGLTPDLILTGVQAIDDLDGLIGPLIACELGLPFLGIVVGMSVHPSGTKAIAVKECPGGVRGEFEVKLPAVLAVQAAERPPRWAPVAKLNEAMNKRHIECIRAPLPANPVVPLLEVMWMRKPQPVRHAEMLSGPVEQVSGQLCDVLADHGVI